MYKRYILAYDLFSKSLEINALAFKYIFDYLNLYTKNLSKLCLNPVFPFTITI